MKKLLLSIIIIVPSLFSQESSIKTSPDIRGGKMFNTILEQLGYNYSNITIPINLLGKHPSFNSETAKILTYPLTYFSNIEHNILQKNYLFKTKQFGFSECNTTNFLNIIKKSISNNQPKIEKFIKQYKTKKLISLVTGGNIPGTNKTGTSNINSFPYLKSFLNEEAAYYNGKLFYSNFYNFHTNIEHPDIFPNSSKNLFKIVTNIFPKIPLIVGSTNDDIHIITNGNNIIYDTGGNDIYRFQYTPKAGDILIILDKKGDDIYTGNDYSCAFNFYGFSMIVDYSGDDLYKGKKLSIASTIGGYSLLWDLKGNDIYQSSLYGQAYAFAGSAILKDDTGEDRYLLQANGQGMAGVDGYALLLDKSGDDFYYARGGANDNLRFENRTLSFAQGASLGHRPHAWGGVGTLLDMSGNDQYEADNFSQGVAYWFGCGSLIDISGNDNYDAHQYVQGTGVHLAAGFLLDFQGNDDYSSYALSLGTGHDLSSGIFYDREGNDNYSIYNFGMGVGSVNGYGFFGDLSGRDNYLFSESDRSIGWGRYERGFSSPGIFIDRKENTNENSIEKDRYNGESIKGSKGHGLFGIAIFSNTSEGSYYSNNSSTSAKSSSNSLLNEPFSNITLNNEQKELYLKASDYSIGNKQIQKESYTKLTNSPNLFINCIIFFMDSHSPALSQYNATYIKLIDSKLLTKAIQNINTNRLNDAKQFTRNFFRAIQESRDSRFKKVVFEMYSNIPSSLKPSVLFAISKLGGVTAKEWPQIITYLTNTNSYIQKSAFTAFIPKNESDYKIIRKALYNQSPPVRDAIALNMIGRDIFIPKLKNANLHCKLINKSFSDFYFSWEIMEGYYLSLKKHWTDKYKIK